MQGPLYSHETSAGANTYRRFPLLQLREQFQISNEKKAISPTQFNHQSTRGHCIMTLEVEMPMADNPQMKQKGRVYVCDLAGTEPAGDIFYALYKKVTFDDGSPPEHKLVGPHKDQRKVRLGRTGVLESAYDGD